MTETSYLQPRNGDLMARRKSTPIIVIGVAVFVIGAALAFIVLRDHGKSKSTPATKAAATSATTAAAAATTPVSTPTPAATAAGTATALLPIPAGKNAVAVQVTQLAGLDGFAKAGDLVNVFATIKNRTDTPLLPRFVKLVATNVEVLNVLAGAPTAAPTGTTVYLLALDPIQAEQIIFFQTNEALYMSLVPKGSAPAVTSGRSYQNAL